MTRSPVNSPLPGAVVPSAADIRALLAKLRDVDLHRRNVAIQDGRRVSIEGCLNPDSSAGQGLRYRLRWTDGTEQVLTIEPSEGGLSVELRPSDHPTPAVRRPLRLVRDELGRTTAPEVRARIHAENAGERELDRFLRRLVRGLFAA